MGADRGKDFHHRPWSLLVPDLLKPPSIPSALVSRSWSEFG